jgi:hypothetical protein
MNRTQAPGRRAQLVQPVLVVSLAALLFAACGDDGPEAEEEEVPPTAGELAPVTVPPAPDSAPDGTGVLSIGGIRRDFDIGTCRRAANDPELVIRGEGRTDSGIPFTVEVQRFVSGDDPVTITDLVSYEDTARILQAQRVEVEDVITDLRDPRAGEPLLELRRGGLSGAGIAGPPGTRDGDEGLVGIALDITC